MTVKFENYDWPSKYDHPLDHQIKTTYALIKYKKLYVLNSMGTGKTLSCLWAADFLALNNKISKVLIVAPLSTLRTVWSDEIFHHIRTRKGVVLHHYNKKKRLEMLNIDAMFYIINHDGIKLMEQELKDFGFDIVIVDELTAFKNNQSERTKCLKRICNGEKRRKYKGVKAVWGLSGSMTANNPLDAYGQIQVVNPNNKYVPTYYTRFRNLLTTQFDEFTYVPKDNWKELLFPMVQPSVRYTIDDCIDLPDVVYEYRDLQMSKEQKRIYDTMRKEYMVELEEGKITAANAGVKAMKLMQISSGAVFDADRNIVNIENTAKNKEMMSIYEQLDRKKLIVFATFRASLENINDQFKKKGISSEMVHGGVSSTKRTKIFHDFQHGDLNVLVMQPVASAHGLTLTAANTILWFGPITSNEIFQQANARIRRPGQLFKQLIIMLQGSAIEKKVYKALQGKEAMNRSLLEMLSSND